MKYLSGGPRSTRGAARFRFAPRFTNRRRYGNLFLQMRKKVWVLRMSKTSSPSEKTDKNQKKGSLPGKLLILLLETLLFLALFAAVALYTVASGPSESARRDLAALLADRGRPGAAAAEYLLAGLGESEAIPAPTAAPAAAEEIAPPESGTAAAEGAALADEDGDGLIFCPVYGRGFTGTMMIVLDPMRVQVGYVPGGRGRTVADFAEYFGAVAAINAGGFQDEGGSGDGSTPDSLVVYDGEMYCDKRGTRQGFAGIDANGKLHVGKFSREEVAALGIRWGAAFGPVLIRDGVLSDPETLRSDLNPRSAIGQREDGAILLLVVDGRQVVSMGATVADMAEVMRSFGAVNACNLDGGTSALLWYRGEYLNDRAELFRPRPVPDVFLVTEGGAEK